MRDPLMIIVRRLAAELPDLPAESNWPPCLRLCGLAPPLEVFPTPLKEASLAFLISLHTTYVAMLAARILRGRLKRSARAVQLFGRLAVVESHTLWYFGHHSCLLVGFDAMGIWHFWMFTLFHPFLLFCTYFLPISTTSTFFLG